MGGAGVGGTCVRACAFQTCEYACVCVCVCVCQCVCTGVGGTGVGGVGVGPAVGDNTLTAKPFSGDLNPLTNATPRVVKGLGRAA